MDSTSDASGAIEMGMAFHLRPVSRFWVFGLVGVWVILGLSARVTAEEALHERIDRMIEAGQFGPAAGLAGDGEFLRRAYVALNGTIPSAGEARDFFDDTNAKKRESLIGRLLASPAYARHMATVFDVMLMERRADVSIPTPEWRKYL
jgi:hypothetical protein